jgi:type II secretory pathway component GspD/PulD (secretin)
VEAGGAIGQISPNTRILADKRSNSLLLMGQKGDIRILLDVVKQIDVMLAQVIIEAVIIEVTLSDNLSFGFDWLQRSMTAYEAGSIGPGGGVTTMDPIASWGGGHSSPAPPRPSATPPPSRVTPR